ncbi:radical SAM family heme chaperone HemW [Faecalispora anaeroviscerum]|uniref:radical SAM family heme chaperone HemW n=1 Tax=Faecalispora anaeroviscerum TaxID=2991836 RepID=UPI0024B9442E|nr:radical SAM family heme chaperone HemW [Faecalispora anaeroviscerum]
MSRTPIGLYVHVPFCKAKCPYCDFYSIRGKEEEKDAYTEQMKRLLYAAAARLNREADTLYFGGGTPSVLGADRIAGLLDAARQNWGLSGAEITVEVNPGEYEPGFFETLQKAGVNRLSMGLQSADEEELRLLGRRHSAGQVRQAVREAQQAGFDNISLDLMLAVQRQTRESLRRSIAFCAECGVQHVSSYLLKVEQGTVYYKRRNEMILPDEDESAELYLLACRELEQAGFRQYEVSNFAVPGNESRHNLKYWNAEEYYGAGPSAHSFLDGRRYYYPGDLEAFLLEPQNICEGDGGSPEEYAMLRLRLCGGLRQKEYQERFGKPLPQEYFERARRYAEQGLVVCDQETIRFTPRGFLVSNVLIAYILLG